MARAGPSDYHRVLVKRLRLLDEKLRGECGEFQSRAYVDTGPVVERSLAVAAGLGWTGKNTCVIHPRAGVIWVFAVLVTSLGVSESAGQQVSELASQQVSELAGSRVGMEVPDRCGSCTRCIEACPTGALVAPYEMDARRCISYLTIEHKAPIAAELMEEMGRQVFGCDICQDVCPWNARTLRDRKDWCYPTLSANNAERMGHPTVDPELAPRPELVNPALEWLGFTRREVVRPPVQRLAGAKGGIQGPQAECGDCHGQQRPGPICAKTRGVGRSRRRGPAHGGAMGAGPAA